MVGVLKRADVKPLCIREFSLEGRVYRGPTIEHCEKKGQCYTVNVYTSDDGFTQVVCKDSRGQPRYYHGKCLLDDERCPYKRLTPEGM